MSGSRIITGDEDRLDNVHPGDILREDYLIGSEIPASEVAEGAGLDMGQLSGILSRQQPVDAMSISALPGISAYRRVFSSDCRSIMIWKRSAGPAVPNWTRSASAQPDSGG